VPHEKKPGSKEPGLRHWPREADTITFQEGLLNFRATGGGGQMRNANAQRGNSMVRVRASQQPPGPHVSHAGIGGCIPSPKFAASRLRNTDSKQIEKKTKIPVWFSPEVLLKGHREGEENF
jgi:hypothetical protein